jgi:hypothetical protein
VNINTTDPLFTGSRFPCVTTVAGGKCGEPSVAVVAGKPLCAMHKEGASDVAAFVAGVMRGGAA